MYLWIYLDLYINEIDERPFENRSEIAGRGNIEYHTPHERYLRYLADSEDG